MKKLIITSKLLLIGLSVVFAQETLSLKKFNYGLDLSLITHPINVFDKTVTQYGIRPTVYYNLNQHFFLQTGIGVENCKYENFEKYELNGNVENLDYIRKYVRFGIPLLVGYQNNFSNSDFGYNIKLGVLYNVDLIYYAYVNSSITSVSSGEAYYKPSLSKSLSLARLAFDTSVGLSYDISQNHSLGLSFYFLILHKNQIVRHLWQQNWGSRYQTGLRIAYKFNFW